MSAHTSGPWTSPSTLAKSWGVHVSTVRRWARWGKIESIRTPTGRIRVRPRHLPPAKGATDLADLEV